MIQMYLRMISEFLQKKRAWENDNFDRVFNYMWWVKIYIFPREKNDDFCGKSWLEWRISDKMNRVRGKQIKRRSAGLFELPSQLHPSILPHSTKSLTLFYSPVIWHLCKKTVLEMGKRIANLGISLLFEAVGAKCRTKIGVL